jgi:hypothetical protein
MRKASKKSIIAGALALAMVLTGTGYAAWTKTLNIQSKATTGDFDVQFVDLGLYAQYGDENHGWSIVDGVGDKGYVPSDFFLRGTSNYNKIAKDGSIQQYKDRAKKYNNIDFSAELKDAEPIKRQVGPYLTTNTNGSHNIGVDINNIYPGYAQAFRTDIVSLGTVAAKLSNIKFIVSSKAANGGLSTDTVEKLLGVAIYVHKEGDGITGEDAAFALVKSLGAKQEDVFRVGGVDFLRLSALKNLDAKKIKDAIKDAEIYTSPETNRRMDLYLGIAMDPDLDGKYTTGTADKMIETRGDSDSQNQIAHIDIQFNWDQFNIGKKEAKPNILEKQNGNAKTPQKPQP